MLKENMTKISRSRKITTTKKCEGNTRATFMLVGGWSNPRSLLQTVKMALEMCKVPVAHRLVYFVRPSRSEIT